MASPSPSTSAGGCCVLSRRTATLLLLLSAVPIALLISALTDDSPSAYTYSGAGLFRECAKWDPAGRRFIASSFFEGTVVEIPAGDAESGVLEERTVVRDGDVAGNGSVGLVVDPARGRAVVVYGDILGGRFAAVAAYRLDSWERIFLTKISGPEDEPSQADDVAVDNEGNAYITDAKASKIWKVGANGELLSVIRNDLFQIKEWHSSFVALNGIVYHPNGYLLVIHTASGKLFKVHPGTEEVKLVKVKGSLFMGDGLEILSPTKIVVAGAVATRQVESSDDWETATVTGRYVGPLYRIASAATVKDGKVYINHLVGGGLKKRSHVIAEAAFTPVNVK